MLFYIFLVFLGIGRNEFDSLKKRVKLFCEFPFMDKSNAQILNDNCPNYLYILPSILIIVKVFEYECNQGNVEEGFS